MKCPICGCKMKEEFMCPYCKITGKQVKNASNLKAKERIKKKDTKEVYNSNYLPCDVNNTRLMVICLLGGLLGAHQIYVGRYKWGIFWAMSIIYTVTMFTLKEYIFEANKVLAILNNIGYVLGAIFIFCWISDFIKILFKKFTIPVVLGEDK